VHRSIVLILLVAWIVAGCFAASPTTLAPPSSSPAPPSATAVAGVPRCEDLDEYSAPEEWYRDEPILERWACGR
jgi:hypothetical protein